MLALYTSCAAVLVSGIVGAIFTDEVLRKYYLHILYICACFFLSFCIITLSEHCKLRGKTNSILEPVTPETALRPAWLKGFAAFCKRRPIYGMAFFTFAFFLIISLVLSSVFDAEEDWRIGSDPWSAEMLLIISAIAVLAVAFVVANHEKYELKPTNFSYEPFDENIVIPMKVYVPKLVAVLVTGGLNIFGGLLLQFFLIVCLVSICSLSEQRITDVMQGSKMQHTVVICTITCFNFVVVFCLIERFLKAREVTKDKLLGTFERNWQWNLKACQSLLPEIEVDSLEDLRLAVLEKMDDPQLTNEQKKVVDYIKRPLWETKSFR